MATRKPGNPDGANAEPIPFKVPRGGDWLDSWDKPVEIAQPEPVVELEPQPTPSNVIPQEEEVAPRPPVQKVQTPEPEKAKKAAPKKVPAKKAPAGKRTKARPKRADIGFRPDLEEATSKLRKHVIAHAEEDYVTRTDVVAQATCAVARALDTIHCGQVPRRGHYRSISAAAYDAALQDAFYKGTAEHYIENNVQSLPDRLLQLCYEQYRQRNGLAED